MKTPYDVFENVQSAPFKKVNAYIEIVASSNPRLNAMAIDAQLTIKAVLSRRYTHVGITIVDNFADLKELVVKKPDLVVLGMKLILLDPSQSYDDSPKIWLSGYLHERGIIFTGSDTTALALEFEKHIAKQKVIDAGLKSSKYFVSTLIAPNTKHSLHYPLFVKPTNRGDSKGIDDESVVYSQLELEAKVLSIHQDCSSDALVEEYLPGREFSVAVVRRPQSDNLIALPVEIIAPANTQGNSFLSETVKEADTEKVVGIDDSTLTESLNNLAIGVFKALGSRDYGRIDMRLDAFGMPSFIEANLMPGLSDHGYLSKCFKLNNQAAYSDMILLIVKLGFERAAFPLATNVSGTANNDLHTDAVEVLLADPELIA